jgi:hypothetical protein
MKERVTGWLGPKEAPVVEQEVPREKVANDKEANITNDGAHPPSDTDRDSDEISLDAQAGVQNAQAFAKVWSKQQLILAYITYVPRIPTPFNTKHALTPTPASGSSSSSMPCSRACPPP